jgi:hypothetical protein
MPINTSTVGAEEELQVRLARHAVPNQPRFIAAGLGNQGLSARDRFWLVRNQCEQRIRSRLTRIIGADFKDPSKRQDNYSCWLQRYRHANERHTCNGVLSLCLG